MDLRVCFYHIIPSTYGEIGLIWSICNGKGMVEQILLPREGKSMKTLIKDILPESNAGKEQDVPQVAAKIAAYLQGQKVIFRLSDLGRENLKAGFRQDVLFQTLKIPLGMVDTYGGLAAKIDHPKAARAVGTALATNPFPLLIPCHRVVRADGHPGCFGGGETMKRRLLEMEGVSFDRAGRVACGHIH